MKWVRIAALMLAVFLTGCATITRGTSEVLIIETVPSGADVYILRGDSTCTTPCALSLKRTGTYTVEIRKAGFKPVTTDILTGLADAGAAGMAGNVLLGGIVGAAIDATSGATKQLIPNPLKVTLEALADQAPLR